MEYDLVRLFEHPLRFRKYIPSAIVLFGGNSDVGQCEIAVEWKQSQTGTANTGTLTLSWDISTLRPHFAEIDEELDILRTRDEDQATQVEEAAVVVAVAVMAHIEPDTLFTRRSSIGTRHDYYLNEVRDEMIEIAGQRKGGLLDLFKKKRKQSDKNSALRKRWVSVMIARKRPRSRTEGLHP
jgi:hypothetical protein